MAVQFSSKSQPFVTNLEPQDIERRERDLKNAEVLYLHVDTNENGDENIDVIGNILVGLQKVEHHIKEFSDVEQCFTYIHGRPNAKIYLILSNGLNETKMSTLKEYSHVLSIYQFDSPSPWIKEEDVPADSNSFNALFHQLNSRHRLSHSDIASRNSVDFLPQNSIVDSRLFIKYQLLMEILLRLPVTEKSKKDFIDWCLENYSKNPKDKEDIDRFAATFTPDQVIAWYTKQSFANRILSRTFATNDLRLIYKTRYFIRPLYVELKQLHENTFAVLDPQIRVYRGKTMSINDFVKLQASIGKLVITKCFVSASVDEAVARFFSGDTEIQDGEVAVIFRMKIDKFENKSKAFAYIGHRSTKPDEAEFLLGPGIIFRNKNIDTTKENMFIVELVHTSAEEEIEEEIIRSNADYLERAQNIETADEFELFIDNASNPLNEQIIPQPSGVQDDEQNNQPIEPQPSGVQDGEQNNQPIEPQPSGVQDDEQNNQPIDPQPSGVQHDEQNNQPIEPQLIPMIQQQTTQQMNEHLLQANPLTGRVWLAAAKHFWKELNELQRSDICDGSSAIFSMDQTPYDEDEDILRQTPTVIIGRIFPRSNIYHKRAIKIEISFPPAYPFDPPVVRILTRIYHPNVTREGILYVNILQRNGSWLSTTPLTSVITAVVNIIDNPDIDLAADIDVAREYVENRAEFDRKALEMAREHGLPRQ